MKVWDFKQKNGLLPITSRCSKPCPRPSLPPCRRYYGSGKRRTLMSLSNLCMVYSFLSPCIGVSIRARNFSLFVDVSTTLNHFPVVARAACPMYSSAVSIRRKTLGYSTNATRSNLLARGDCFAKTARSDVQQRKDWIFRTVSKTEILAFSVL